MTDDLMLRKARLVIEGAELRAGIVTSKGAVQVGLSTESLGRSVLGLTVNFIYPGLQNLLIRKSTGLRVLIPFVIAGISLVSKKIRIKPVIRGAIVVATMAVIGRLLVRQKAHDSARA